MIRTVIAFAGAALFFASTAAAQQPGHHNMPMPQAAPQPASGMCGAEDPAKPGGMSMGCGGCSMMRGMMSAAPSGALAAAPNANDSPRMVQMRGEMLKAMGEVMLKYGKMMEGAK